MRSPLRLIAVLALAALLVAVCVPAVHAGALPDLHTMAVQGASLAALPLFGLRPVLAPDDGAGSGGGGQVLTREDVEAMIKGKFGADVNPDMLRRLTELTVNLAKAEQDRDAFKTQLATAQQRVPDGAVVLTGDEAKAYETLKSREGAGETPLKSAAEALTQAGTEAAELAALRASRSLADAVAAETAAGKPLNQLALETYVRDLQTEVADHTENGKTVKRAFAVVKDAAGNVTKTLLSDHLAKEHTALMPALTAPASGTTSATPTRGAFPVTTGTPAGTATGTGGTTATGGTDSPVDDFLARRNAARTGQKPADAPVTA